MSALGILRALQRDLEAEAEHYHAAQLVKRFFGAYVGALGVSLAAAGWHVAGWAALWSLLAGAGLAALEHVDASVPWRRVLSVVRDAQDAADRPPAVVPGVSTPTLRAPSAPPGR